MRQTVLARRGRASRVVLAGGALLLLSAASAQAGLTITLTTRAAGRISDGQCSLSEAVDAINQQTTVFDCDGAGADTIFAPIGDYSIPDGLYLARPMSILGAGMNLTNLRTNASGYWAAVQVAPFLTSPVVLAGVTIRGDAPLQQVATGVFVDVDSSVTFHSARVTGFNGTGIWSSFGNLELNHTVVDNNVDWSGIWIDGFGQGGTGGLNFINSSTINNNSCNQDGGHGGGIHNQAYLNIHRSTIANNTATGKGGGIYTVQVPNDGGGAYLELHHATVAFNSAANGGGVLIDPSAVNFMVQATLVANNSAPTAPDYSGGWRSLPDVPRDPNFIGNRSGLAAGAFTSADLSGTAQLGSLFDMGGQTRTVFLRSNSPAINRSLDDGSTEDQRGFGALSGTRRDIGAYELDTAWQLENLNVAQQSSDLLVSQFDSGFQQSYGIILFADANNDLVTFQVPVPIAGTFPIRVRVQKGNGRGQFQLSVADSVNGPYTNVGPAQDLYAASTSFTELTISTGRSFTVGQKFFKFTVVGKNAASNGRALYLDTVRLN